MFRFEHQEYINMLWVIPVLIGIYLIYVYYRRTRISRLGDTHLVRRLVPGLAQLRNHVKAILLFLLIATLIVAYANPQWGNKKEKVTTESSDIYIALDISQSMMAEDVSPNRLERAKRLAQNIVKALKGNRIGIILFAGNAYLQMPLSTDYSAALLFISSANTRQAATQGTAIGEAIDLALRAYEPGKASQRALIILTDGENHEEEVLTKATEASSAGLHIYTVGVGTEEGTFIPYTTQGRELFKRDDDGNPVQSALNLVMIEELAKAGNGKSYLVGQGNEVVTGLQEAIATLEKQEVEQRSFTDFASYFQYLLIFGIILMTVEFIIPERRKTAF